MNKRKVLALFFILLQLFLIFEVLKNYWADKKVNYLAYEVFPKGGCLAPSTEALLIKLRKWSSRDPRVWELSAVYSLEKMKKMRINEDRYLWAKTAYDQATTAVWCAPTIKQYQNLRDRCQGWKKIFAEATGKPPN